MGAHAVGARKGRTQGAHARGARRGRTQGAHARGARKGRAQGAHAGGARRGRAQGAHQGARAVVVGRRRSIMRRTGSWGCFHRSPELRDLDDCGPAHSHCTLIPTQIARGAAGEIAFSLGQLLGFGMKLPLGLNELLVKKPAVA